MKIVNNFERPTCPAESLRPGDVMTYRLHDKWTAPNMVLHHDDVEDRELTRTMSAGRVYYVDMSNGRMGYLMPADLVILLTAILTIDREPQQ